MRQFVSCSVILLSFLIGSHLKAQHASILSAPPEERLPLFWRYCTSEMLSDKDSLTVHLFLNKIENGADSLRDTQLKAYAQYFSKCWRILFSKEYEKHFAPGDYQSAVEQLTKAKEWATTNNYPDIAASCELYTGEVYYRATRYGIAFEHLLNANASFKKIGYTQMSNVATYLAMIGLHFYQFEEFDKALEIFLEATKYKFYLPRMELNTFNAIGLIYVRTHQDEKAIQYFRNTITKATQFNDPAWIGIAAGNLGNIYLSENKNDSALFYHRWNYSINKNAAYRAAEDAAKTALSIAAVFVNLSKPDSALYYTGVGKEMAAKYIHDSTEMLDFKRRWEKVMIAYLKNKEDYKGALMLTDSLALTEQRFRSRMDGKILNRAIEKSEAALYDSRITLLKSQKDLVQVRLYFILASFALVIIIGAVIFRDRSLRKKREMLFAEKDNQILLGEKLRAEAGLKHAEELLKAYVDMIKEKTTLIVHLESELTDRKKTAFSEPDLQTITSNREKLRASSILTENDWQQFRTLFEQVYPGFSFRVKENYPDLSPAENRLLFLTKLKLSSREMAAMLGVSLYTIHKLRYRVRKKINLEEESSFDAVIQKIN